MERYDDDELVYLMRCGNFMAKECLCHKYYGYIRHWIRPFCFGAYGMDMEDYIQIAMLNFLSILECYRDDQCTSLRTFMKVSVVRRFLSVLRPGLLRETRRNSIVISLDENIGDENSLRYEEVVEDPKQSYCPEIILMVKETEIAYMSDICQKASPRELAVMTYKRDGYNEKEISQKLDISIKSVYNAVYRYHKKAQVIDDLK